MYERSDSEVEAIKELLSPHFGSEFAPEELSDGEQQITEQVLEYVASRFTKMKYILGLALDFTIVAQRLSNVDDYAKSFRQQLTVKELFERYEVVTERAGRQANTLTLKFGQAQEGIRSIEEAVAQFFHKLNRSKYPSAYVYNTGQWQKFPDLLLRYEQVPLDNGALGILTVIMGWILRCRSKSKTFTFLLVTLNSSLVASLNRFKVIKFLVWRLFYPSMTKRVLY